MTTYRVVEAPTHDQMHRFYTLANLLEFADELRSMNVDPSTVLIRSERQIEHRIEEPRV